MLRKIILCSAVAVVLPLSAVGAQPVRPLPPPIPTPVPPQPPLVRASGQVQTGEGVVDVELLVLNDDAALHLRWPGEHDREINWLTKPGDVLSLLADKRMAFLWAPLTEWAGPALERMRNRRLAKLQAAAAIGESAQAAAATIESTVRPRTRATLQLAGFLIETGQPNEAERILQERLATMPLARDKSRWNEIEWFTVASRIATARTARGDIRGALAEYDLAQTTLGDSPYAINALVNRAALLLRDRRYAEALSVIDPAWKQWQATRSDDKVGGSERQFAWIRACALEGLGRRAEADAAFQPVLAAKDSWDRDFVIDSDQKLQMRGLVCMRRTAAVKAMIAENIRNGFSSNALLIFQPAYRPLFDADFWATITSDPELQKLVRERMRELPPELAPALNGWRR
jgi:hypothetical protein